MGKNLERLRDAAILGVMITLALTLLSYMFGGEITPALILMNYIRVVVGGFILFWILGK